MDQTFMVLLLKKRVQILQWTRCQRRAVARLQTTRRTSYPATAALTVLRHSLREQLPPARKSPQRMLKMAERGAVKHGPQPEASSKGGETPPHWAQKCAELKSQPCNVLKIEPVDFRVDMRQKVNRRKIPLVAPKCRGYSMPPILAVFAGHRGRGDHLWGEQNKSPIPTNGNRAGRR